MTVGILPIRPQVYFCSSHCFTEKYAGKAHSLECWQKVAIVVLAVFTLVIGGLALSYYCRNRLVDQLHAAECQKVDARVEALRARIEVGDPHINDQTLGQLSGNGRYFIAIANTSSLTIPFTREELPEGIYCVYSCATSRNSEYLTGKPIAQYEELVKEFGIDKVYRLNVINSAVANSDRLPRGLVLGRNKEVNTQEIARFSKAHS